MNCQPLHLDRLGCVYHLRAAGADINGLLRAQNGHVVEVVATLDLCRSCVDTGALGRFA